MSKLRVYTPLASMVQKLNWACVSSAEFIFLFYEYALNSGWLVGWSVVLGATAL